MHVMTVLSWCIPEPSDPRLTMRVWKAKYFVFSLSSGLACLHMHRASGLNTALFARQSSAEMYKGACMCAQITASHTVSYRVTKQVSLPYRQRIKMQRDRV